MSPTYPIKLKNQWPGFGLPDEQLASMAKQLGCNHPHFPDAATMHFRSAEKLLIFTCYEFFLLPYVFLQTVIGLEKVLRCYYQNEQPPLSLKDMLLKAAADGLIPDETFSNLPSELKLDGIRCSFSEANEKLTELIPDLRNKIAHGDYNLTPEFLPLALKVRAYADAVADHLPKEMRWG